MLAGWAHCHGPRPRHSTPVIIGPHTNMTITGPPPGSYFLRSSSLGLKTASCFLHYFFSVFALFASRWPHPPSGPSMTCTILRDLTPPPEIIIKRGHERGSHILKVLFPMRGRFAPILLMSWNATKCPNQYGGRIITVEVRD